MSPGTGYVEPEIIRIMYGEEKASRSAASSVNLDSISSEASKGGEPAPSEVNKTESALETIYRIVGEIFNSYIIVEKGDSCLIIDKHAAHERQIFERFKRNMNNGGRASVILALPREVMLMSGEVALIEEYRSEIEAVGFEFTSSRNTVSLSAIPDGIDINEAAGMIESIAGALADSTGSVELTRDLVFEKALYQASCKAAIKAGRIYPDEYIEKLVDDLMKMPDITYCPHGRPVAFEMKKSALDHRFKRS